MAHFVGKTGSVYIADQLIQDGESAWIALVDPDVTFSNASDRKRGAWSAKMAAAAAVSNGDILAALAVASMDLTAYTKLMAWAKCSVGVGAGDLQVGVSETAAMGGSPVWVDLPALTAATWKHCVIDITTTGLNAVISCGAKLAQNDPGAFDLYLDDIRASRLAAGVYRWDLERGAKTREVTTFRDSGERANMVTGKFWGGSFDAHKDGAPLGVGEEIALELRESSTAGQAWHGMAHILNCRALTQYDDVVGYRYAFEGTGPLTVPTA